MLRHATGFYLANAGQDTRAIQLYLGHKNIHSAHGAIYRAESAAIQGFLEGLTPGSGMPHPAPLARQAGFPGAGWDAPPRRRGRGAAGFGSGAVASEAQDMITIASYRIKTLASRGDHTLDFVRSQCSRERSSTFFSRPPRNFKHFGVWRGMTAAIVSWFP
jgi:hypothetical protein